MSDRYILWINMKISNYPVVGRIERDSSIIGVYKTKENAIKRAEEMCDGGKYISDDFYIGKVEWEE